MKKFLFITLFSVSINATAQIPIAEIIKAGVKKVIVAVDLKIQRIQLKTIWLQNAQKTLENKMSQTKLAEIKDWVNRQKELYADYFEELKKVKSAISNWQKVKDIISDQVAIVREYKDAWSVFRVDRNFSADELKFMEQVYSGMLTESLKNLDRLYLVLNAYVTQMTDAKRIAIINTAATRTEQIYLDLKNFNNQNRSLGLQRAHERGDIEYARKLYGL